MVSPEQRLSQIVDALEGVGLRCLVMGGHAVRYYGFQRNTIDFDLHLAPEDWPRLPERLVDASSAFGQPAVEGPSRRPRSFRRFQIGRLPDGREEWLEFWCRNHLLAPFPELFARREEGNHGGRALPFLSLPDLIRSKETERASDWQDIAVLEEFLDERRLARVGPGTLTPTDFLSGVRSRRGMELAFRNGWLADTSIVGPALKTSRRSATQAILLPFAPDAPALPTTVPAIEPIILERLRAVKPASPLHFALVEAVRRQYRTTAQAEDRADKEAAGRDRDR